MRGALAFSSSFLLLLSGSSTFAVSEVADSLEKTDETSIQHTNDHSKFLFCLFSLDFFLTKTNITIQLPILILLQVFWGFFCLFKGTLSMQLAACSASAGWHTSHCGGRSSEIWWGKQWIMNVVLSQEPQMWYCKSQINSSLLGLGGFPGPCRCVFPHMPLKRWLQPYPQITAKCWARLQFHQTLNRIDHNYVFGCNITPPGSTDSRDVGTTY